MSTLIKTTEIYRLDSEEQVDAFITELKENATDYILKSYTSTHKEKKAKGEVIDEGYEVKVTKEFNNFWEC